MDIDSIAKLLRSRWKTAVAAFVLVATVILGVWVVSPASYTATSVLYVSAQTVDTTSTAYLQSAQLSAERVRSYTELATSQRVCEAVVQDGAQDSYSSAEVCAKLKASNPLNTVLIEISAVDSNPGAAASIADQAANSVIALAQELDSPIAPTSSPLPVVLKLVQPAQAPTVPSSIGLSVALPIAVLSSTVAGLLAAMMHQRLDTKVRGREQLSRAVDAPVLGVIPDSGDENTISTDGDSRVLEAFRRVRTNVQFIAVDTKPRIFAVSSCLAGEGKTTVVISLARVLSAAGSKVLVIDADLRRPMVAQRLGLEGSVGLSTTFVTSISPHQAVQSSALGFDVLASGKLPPNPNELVASSQMKNLVQHLKSRYDFVLIDTPPMLAVADALSCAAVADQLLVVARYGKSSISDLTLCKEMIETARLAVGGCVLNGVPLKGEFAASEYSQYYQSHYRNPLPRSS